MLREQGWGASQPIGRACCRAERCPRPSHIFDEPCFRDVFRPGDQVEAYVGAGSGARRLARNLDLPVFKSGAVVRGRLI